MSKANIPLEYSVFFLFNARRQSSCRTDPQNYSVSSSQSFDCPLSRTYSQANLEEIKHSLIFHTLPICECAGE